MTSKPYKLYIIKKKKILKKKGRKKGLPTLANKNYTVLKSKIIKTNRVDIGSRLEG